MDSVFGVVDHKTLIGGGEAASLLLSELEEEQNLFVESKEPEGIIIFEKFCF